MLRLLAAGAVATGSLVVVPPPAAAASCGTLPAVVQGNPGVQPMQRGFAYLYHSSAGWSLRVTHASHSKVVVTGTIRVSGALSNLRTVHLEKGDGVAISKDRSFLSFRMTNVGHLDGFDVSAGCSQRLTLNVRADGVGLPTTRVYLGKNRVHPTSVPVTVERH